MNREPFALGGGFDVNGAMSWCVAQCVVEEIPDDAQRLHKARPGRGDVSALHARRSD
jgi:hypothetical protein